MTPTDRVTVLQIKKYPNRRYYDATRSCHVTLQDLYDQVQAGQDICVTDSRTEADITNLVLLQMLLEKEPPKLDLFPSSILHMMVRSNLPGLQESFDRVLGPFLRLYATSQRQFEAYWRRMMPANLTSPMEWANSMVQAFSPGPGGAGRDGSAAASPDEVPASPSTEETAGPPSARPQADGETLAELRRQVADLNRRLEGLSPADVREPDGTGDS